MPVINYQKQFADLVETRQKRQTIRAPWKNGKFPFKVGSRLFHYYALRTKQKRKLGEDDCTHVEPIKIFPEGPFICSNEFYPEIGDDVFEHSATTLFPIQDKEGFARADGFESWDEMRAWFRETHGLPFHGYLIRW